MYVSYSVPRDSMKGLKSISLGCMFDQSDFEERMYGNIFCLVRHKLWRATHWLEENFADSSHMQAYFCLATKSDKTDKVLEIDAFLGAESIKKLNEMIRVKFVGKIEGHRFTEYSGGVWNAPDYQTYVKKKLLNGYIYATYYDIDRMGCAYVFDDYLREKWEKIEVKEWKVNEFASAYFAKRAFLMEAAKKNTDGDYYSY